MRIFFFSNSQVRITAVIILSLSITSCAIFGGAIATKTASDILDDAELKFNNASATAVAQANGAMLNANDQLGIALWNARTQMDQVMDKQVSKLSEENRKLLIAIDKMANSVGSIENTAVKISDTFALDLRDIMGGIPFVSQKLVMQRVTGLTHVQGQYHNNIELYGSYIGLPGEEHRSEVSLTINGRDIEATSVPKALHHRTLEITPAALEPFYNPAGVAFVEATLTVKQEFKDCLIGAIGCGWEEKSYELPLHLVLYPQFAGNLKYSLSFEAYSWKNAGTLSNEKTGASHHCNKNCKGHRGAPYDVYITVNGGEKATQMLQSPGDQRLTSVTQCQCIGGTCGYDENRGNSINPSKTTATCSWQARSHPSKWKITATVDTWAKIDDRKFDGNVGLNYGQLSVIEVPRHTTSVRLTGKLFLGDPIDVFADEERTKGSIVVAKIETMQDGTKRIYITPVTPS